MQLLQIDSLDVSLCQILYVCKECIGIVFGGLRKRVDKFLKLGIGPRIACESCETVKCVRILRLIRSELQKGGKHPQRASRDG